MANPETTPHFASSKNFHIDKDYVAWVKWYLFYSSKEAAEKLQQLVAELQQTENKINTTLH